MLSTICVVAGAVGNILPVEPNPTHFTRSRQFRGLNVHRRRIGILSAVCADCVVNTTLESCWFVLIHRIRTRAMRNICFN